MFNKIFSSLRGNKSHNTQQAAPQPQPEQEAHTVADDLITVYDANGRPMQISRDEWRLNVLIPHLEKAHNDPDELYRLILSAIDDGFLADVLQASIRLVAIDPLIERSHCLRAILLMRTEQLDAAESILQAAINRIGKTGVLLTNLAKVYSTRDATATADGLLWESIQLDPNQENGLLWWLSIARERTGETGYVKALSTAASLPNSWQPQLWLARHHLEQGELPLALALYRAVLKQGLYDRNALTMMSGDLGKKGHIALIPELVAPVYQVQQHSPQTGLNLLQAYLDLADIESGMTLLNQLYALDMPPLKENLDHFCDAFQELKNRNFEPPAQMDSTPPEINFAALDRPIWHYGLRNPDWLFAAKPTTAPRIALMSFGKRAPTEEGAGQSQKEDDLGRTSRALPLYLAETIHYWTDYASRTYIPTLAGAGPVLFRSDGNDEHLLDQLQDDFDYLISGDICPLEADALEVSCRLWNFKERSLVFEDSFRIDTQDAAGVRELEKRLLIHIGQVRNTPLDNFYLSPSQDALPIYLSQLGQSLILTIMNNSISPKETVWGERNMLEWPLKMALHWPDALVPKIMFLSGLGKAAGYHSDLLHGFEKRAFDMLRKLRQQHPLTGHLEPLLWEIFGKHEQFSQPQEPPSNASPEAYQQWLERLGTLDD